MKTEHSQPTPAAETSRTLDRYADRPLGTSDLVLLCSFGPDLTAERTTKEVRRALLAAGFSPAAAGKLIRSSSLVRRGDGRRLRLREFQPDPADRTDDAIPSKGWRSRP